MPENQESQSLDSEDWEIALQPYAAYPGAAFNLARHLMSIREFLRTQPPDVPQAIAALDQAAESLYPLTDFHKGAYDLYRTVIEGRATTAHEALMDSLGITY